MEAGTLESEIFETSRSSPSPAHPTAQMRNSAQGPGLRKFTGQCRSESRVSVLVNQEESLAIEESSPEDAYRARKVRT